MAQSQEHQELESFLGLDPRKDELALYITALRFEPITRDIRSILEQYCRRRIGIPTADAELVDLTRLPIDHRGLPFYRGARVKYRGASQNVGLIRRVDRRRHEARVTWLEPRGEGPVHLSGLELC